MISLEKETKNEVVLTVQETKRQKAITNLLVLVSIASTMTIAVSAASVIRKIFGF